MNSNIGTEIRKGMCVYVRVACIHGQSDEISFHKCLGIFFCVFCQTFIWLLINWKERSDESNLSM